MMFPDRFKMAWDTTDGLVADNISKPVKKVIVNLEFRDNIITKEVDMFVLHHPPIFGPEKRSPILLTKNEFW